MNTPPSHIPPPAPRQPVKGPFFYLQTVIAVAFILATFFTAWTPASLFPASWYEKISQAFSAPDQQATVLPEWQTPTPRPNPRVGIVAGHWGNDSGAVCANGTTEAEINLEVATRAKESLTAEGYDVDLLKEFDVRLDSYKAAVLVSIHADSCDYINDQATGFKVAAAMSTMYPERASRLTSCLRTRYANATGLAFHPGSVTPDMTSYHAFEEIDKNTTAAIVEIGFLNLDFQMLTKHPDLVANGVTQGILCFIRNEDVEPESTDTP